MRATISMLVTDMPDNLKGKTLICKVDNQVLKAVWERKGTSKNLALNKIGKQIYLNSAKERPGERPMERASLTLFACFPRKEGPGTLSGRFSKNR